MNPPRSLRARTSVAATAVLALTAGLLVGAAGTSSASPTSENSSTKAAAVAAKGKPHHHKPHHHKPKGKVVWDSTSFTPGAGVVAAHGKVPGGKRKLQLQVKIKGGWDTFGKTKTKKNGKFTVSAPLDWYGTHKVRVTTKGKKNRFSGKTVVTVGVPYTPRGTPGSFTYLIGDSVESNWRFNPCKTIDYQVNASEVGPMGIVLAQMAMAQASYATGIPVRYAGTNTIIPASNYNDPVLSPPGVELTIAWGSFAEVPEFQAQNKAGFGGPSQGVYARNSKGKKVVATTQSGVTIATEYYLDGSFAPNFDSATNATMGEVLIHEIGHALGLGHTPNDAQEIMNGFTYEPYPDGHRRGLYALGDLDGLEQVGLAQGCMKTIKGQHKDGALQGPPALG